MLISPCRQENEYIVRLRDGHTIDSHFARIGRDLSRDAHMFWPIETLNGYRARLDDYTLHELVRYDPGVERSSMTAMASRYLNTNGVRLCQSRSHQSCHGDGHRLCTLVIIGGVL